MPDKKFLRKSVQLILSTLTLLGYNPLEGTSLRGILLYITVILTEINLISTLIKNWSNFEQRILAIEDLNVNTIAVFMGAELIFSNKNISKYLKIIDTNDFGDRSSEYKEYDEKRNARETFLVKNCRKAIMIIVLNNAVFQLILTCYFHFFQKSDVSDLPLPIEIYFKNSISSFPIYAVIFLLESVIYSYYALIAFCEYAISFVIFEDILFEMKIFCIVVERFEERKKEGQSSGELRDLLRKLAVHHQMIMKRISIGQNIFRKQVIYVCQGFCIQLCIGAYIIENEQMILMKLKHGLVLAAVTMVLALFCNCAQNLLDKNNEMASALYNFQWHNKEIWFQKDFQILMMQVRIEPTIKFFGLSKMDQSSIGSVFKGAYSYLNILHSLAEFKD